MADDRNCGARKIQSAFQIFCLLLLFAAVCVRSLESAPFCRQPDACNLSDLLSDPQLWNPGDKDSQLHRAVLNSWCNLTVQDAVLHSLELEADAFVVKKDKLLCLEAMAEKEQNWVEAEAELKQRCSGEKRELQRVCTKNELLLRSTLTAERENVAADLAACRAIQKSLISVEACNYQKQVGISKCEAERDSCATKLAFQEELVLRKSEEKPPPCSCDDFLIPHEARVRRLQESLGICRFERAQAQAAAEVTPKIGDFQLVQLTRKVNLYFTLFMISITLWAGLAAPLALWAISSGKGEKKRGSYPSDKEVDLPVDLPLFNSEEACVELKALYGKEKERVESSSILTSPNIDGEGDVFLLLPVTLSSDRRFALMKGGGEFTHDKDEAQVFVKAHNKKLVVVLYHSQGYAFPQWTLEVANLQAEDVASAAAPDDPWDGEVLVLWVDDKNTLHMSNAHGEVKSKLFQLITHQHWAQYLQQRAPAVSSNGKLYSGGSRRQREQSSLPSASASRQGPSPSQELVTHSAAHRQGPSPSQEVNTHSATHTLPSIQSSHGALRQNLSYGVSNGDGKVIGDLEGTLRQSRRNYPESGCGSERRPESWRSGD